MRRFLGVLLTLAAVGTACVAAAPQGGRIRMPEVSGAAYLSGDRLLLASDEPNEVALVRGAAARLKSGEVTLRGGESLAEMLAARVGLDDIEDAAADAQGNVYLVTSHGRTRGGDSPEARYRLAQLRFGENGVLAEARGTDALLQAVVNQVPFLADSIRRTPARSGLNIEGLAVDGEGHLLVGLRAPTITESMPREHGGQEDAVVLRVRNPEALFHESPPPADLGETVKLDLRGHGIRGMAYDPVLKATWILSGLSPDPNYEFRSPWALWLWDGRSAPRRVPLPDGLTLDTPEAVCPVETDGEARLLLIQDGRPESPYALIPLPVLK